MVLKKAPKGWVGKMDENNIDHKYAGKLQGSDHLGLYIALAASSAYLQDALKCGLLTSNGIQWSIKISYLQILML